MYGIGLDRERRSGADRYPERTEIVAEELVDALDRGELELLFQPQFASDSGALIGAEALVRWHHPLLGRICGDRLFGMARRTGYAGGLARRLGREAMVAALAWPQPLRLSLNVTADMLADERFPSVTSELLAETGFPAERLTLEITEETLVDDILLSAEHLEPLVASGIRVALDDFGAGFCNFNYLKQLPLHEIKLDRSMVEGIDENDRDLAVLRGIVAMANALGLDTTAEGIERQGQLDAVVAEGCTCWQGFLGGEPMSPAEFAALADLTPPSAFRFS